MNAAARRVLSETLISNAEAARMMCVRPWCVWNWQNKGLLDWAWSGGKRVTSVEAIRRKQEADNTDRVEVIDPVATKRERKRVARKALADLQKMGVLSGN